MGMAKVDINDLTTVLSNFGRTSAAGAGIGTVPEPSALAFLAAAGVIGLLASASQAEVTAARARYYRPTESLPGGWRHDSGSLPPSALFASQGQMGTVLPCRNLKLVVIIRCWVRPNLIRPEAN